MIVRILGEGQFQLADAGTDKLAELDAALDKAVDSGDEAGFRTALEASVRLVRESGTPVPAEELETTADFILPFSDATLDEVRQLLADGKIPGDSLGFPA